MSWPAVIDLCVWENEAVSIDDHATPTRKPTTRVKYIREDVVAELVREAAGNDDSDRA